MIGKKIRKRRKRMKENIFFLLLISKLHGIRLNCCVCVWSYPCLSAQSLTIFLRNAYIQLTNWFRFQSWLNDKMKIFSAHISIRSLFSYISYLYVRNIVSIRETKHFYISTILSYLRQTLSTYNWLYSALRKREG